MMKRLLIGEKYDGHMLLGKADSLGQHVAADGCCQETENVTLEPSE
jgi:hypothetical protein